MFFISLLCLLEMNYISTRPYTVHTLTNVNPCMNVKREIPYIVYCQGRKVYSYDGKQVTWKNGCIRLICTLELDELLDNKAINVAVSLLFSNAH